MNALKRRARRHPEHGHEHEHDHAIRCTSLCCAVQGQRVCVTSLCGEASEAGRLRDLGLREGVCATVLRHGDPLIVRVEDVRLGLGRAAANNVLCEFIDSSNALEVPPLRAS